MIAIKLKIIENKKSELGFEMVLKKTSLKSAGWPQIWWWWVS
jgi:hypothetical protein